MKSTLYIFLTIIFFSYASCVDTSTNIIKDIHIGLHNNNQLRIQIDATNNKLSKARELLLSGDLDADDYRIIKSESEKTINRLEVKLTATATDTSHIAPLWDKAISTMSQLDVLYEKGTVIQKRKVVSSMFPEKLTFDGFQYRTQRVNEAINLISLIDNKLKGIKKGTSHSISDLSQEVTPQGLEPWTH